MIKNVLGTIIFLLFFLYNILAEMYLHIFNYGVSFNWVLFRRLFNIQAALMIKNRGFFIVYVTTSFKYTACLWLILTGMMPKKENIHVL